MHKLGFSFETVEDEKRDAILEAILDLFDEHLGIGEKVVMTYGTKAVQGRTKVKVDRTLEWLRGEPAPSLLDFGIEHSQRSLPFEPAGRKKDVMRPVLVNIARARTPDDSEWQTELETLPEPNL